MISRGAKTLTGSRYVAIELPLLPQKFGWAATTDHPQRRAPRLTYTLMYAEATTVVCTSGVFSVTKVNGSFAPRRVGRGRERPRGRGKNHLPTRASFCHLRLG